MKLDVLNVQDEFQKGFYMKYNENNEYKLKILIEKGFNNEKLINIQINNKKLILV